MQHPFIKRIANEAYRFNFKYRQSRESPEIEQKAGLRTSIFPEKELISRIRNCRLQNGVVRLSQC
jgi:hypothetical protein